MKSKVQIVKPSVKLIWCTKKPQQVIEAAARTCYKSEAKITPDSAAAFVSNLISRGHTAMLEHAVASFKVVCDRGVSHEIVRHRIASFAQESTRYCNYGKAGTIKVIEPPELNAVAYAEWLSAVDVAAEVYMRMLNVGCSPQIARSVLPTCLKTEIVITANFREWRHFLSLRTATAAHPQMRQIAFMIEKQLQAIAPAVFCV